MVGSTITAVVCGTGARAEAARRVPRIQEDTLRTSRRWTAAVVALLCTVAIVGHRAEAGPTADPSLAAGYGAGWLATQINSQGFVPATNGTSPNLGATVDAVLALAAANAGGAAFGRALNYLHGQIDAVAKDTGGVDQPGALAKLIMIAVVAGEAPTAFGGNAASNDLVTRLLATKRTTGTDSGLFGAQDPSFDGAFRQSLAILALTKVGSVPADAVNWLATQQCPDKGWQPYRADTTAACTATDPATFAGEDTNSTAVAAQAFAGLHLTPPKGNALDFLDAAQNADGGFGFLAGTATDANSTGLAIQAIVAGAEAPGAGRWAAGGATPFSALLAVQLGCEAPVADRGAFDFQPQSPLKPNLLATVQAVPGAAQKPFPLAAGAPAATQPVVPCPDTTPSPTTTTTTVVSPAVQEAAATRTGHAGRHPDQGAAALHGLTVRRSKESLTVSSTWCCRARHRRELGVEQAVD